MTAPLLKTKAEQRVEHLNGLGRPLSEQESEDLRRAMHAVYCHDLRQRTLSRQRNEELELLEKLRAEASMPEMYPHGI